MGMKIQNRNIPYSRSNMPGAYLNAQNAARKTSHRDVTTRFNPIEISPAFAHCCPE